MCVGEPGGAGLCFDSFQTEVDNFYYEKCFF